MGAHEHYLDYTGSSIYANSQVEAVFAELRTHLFGNPHSANPSSSLASERVEEGRDIVVRGGGAGLRAGWLCALRALAAPAGQHDGPPLRRRGRSLTPPPAHAPPPQLK